MRCGPGRRILRGFLRRRFGFSRLEDLHTNLRACLLEPLFRAAAEVGDHMEIDEHLIGVEIRQSPRRLAPVNGEVLQFSAERVRAAAALLPELAELDHFLTLSLRGLEFHGETRHRAAALMLRIGEAAGSARLALFIELLAQLSRSQDYVVLSSSDFVPNVDADTIAMIDRVQSYIFERLKREIHMREVADLVGMGESAFSRFFKRNSGNSFTDYVTRLRISQACGLLADSRIPITDICFDVGYTNISNFNRLFRKVRGVTPSDYRRLAGQRTFSKVARIRRGHRPDLGATADPSAA